MYRFNQDMLVEGVRFSCGDIMPDNLPDGTKESLIISQRVDKCEEECCEEEVEPCVSEPSIADDVPLKDLCMSPVAAALEGAGMLTAGDARAHYMEVGTFTDVLGVGEKSSNKLFTLLFGD